MLSAEQRWKAVEIARGNSSGGELKYVKGHLDEDQKIFTPISLPDGFENWRVVWCSELELDADPALHLTIKGANELSSVAEYNSICILEALPAPVATKKPVTYWYKYESWGVRPDLNGGQTYTLSTVWAEEYQDASDVADQCFYEGRYDTVKVEVERPDDLDTWTKCEAEIVPHVWVNFLEAPDGGEYINGETIPAAEYAELLAAGWHAGSYE